MNAIPKDCVTRLADYKGEKANKENLKRIQEDMDKILRETLLEGLQGSDGLRIATERFIQQEQLAALIEKRNAYRNFMVFNERVGYLKNTWANKPHEGLRAILTGSVEGRKGARASVAREQRQLLGQYVEQITTEMERGNLMEAFASGSLDDDIGRALWQINGKSPNMAGLAPDAVKIAKIVHKAQEVARSHANEAGAWIGKLEGYITRQSHDIWKMTKSGLKAWSDSIAPKLDWARMEAMHGAIANREEWLAETYNNLVSGIHLKSEGAIKNTGFKGPGNLGKKMSQERVLHFNSADDWAAYNKEFGTGNLREAIFRGLKSSADNTGLMRVLGPNPEAMYNRLVDAMREDVSKSHNTKLQKAFNKATDPDGWLSNRFKEVTGVTSQAVDQVAARWLANTRAWISMSKLGGAVVSSINDIGTYAAATNFQGRGFLSGIGEAVQAIGSGRPRGEQKEILSSLGVFFDSLIGDMTRTGSLDESFGGHTSRAMQHYFKWNLLNWWTESLRGASALGTSHHLGAQIGKVFDDLPADLRHTLKLSGIEGKDWDVLRENPLRTTEDGKSFMVTDGLPQESADKLRRYITDQAEQAVLEPDSDARAMLRRGTKGGTITGEALRLVTQFKGFPVAFTRQVLGREIYGRGERAFSQGSIAGLSKLIGASVVLGYISMTIKDLLRGKTPRDPTSKNTIVAAMLQGGGAGIYGDFLFGEFSRTGRTPLETAAGPTLGQAAEALKLWSGLTHEDSKGEYVSNRDAGDLMRFGLNNTPFLNLFYIRPVLDYAILYDLQEKMSPGTLRRLEKRMKTEQGQTFFAPPSRDRLTPLTQ